MTPRTSVTDNPRQEHSGEDRKKKNKASKGMESPLMPGKNGNAQGRGCYGSRRQPRDRRILARRNPAAREAGESVGELEGPGKNNDPQGHGFRMIFQKPATLTSRIF